MKIIKARERHHEIHYMLCFPNYAFDCDKDGKVKNLDSLNYQKCIADSIRAGKGVGTIEEYPNTWTDPAIGECDRCGTEVELHGFTNSCPQCETDYNQSGQMLCDRSLWCEGTDEHLSDILNIDSCDTEELFT